MAEEQRCQEGHRLCANNCGFFGSPATMDLCSKCYRDIRLKEDRASSAKIAFEKSLLPPSSSSSPSPFIPAASAAAVSPAIAGVGEEEGDRPQRQQAAVGRCTACRKKVGVMGFRCRCGEVYCGTHRYPEQHRCSFDFKAAGRDEISRANPLVKADKLGGTRI